MLIPDIPLAQIAVIVGEGNEACIPIVRPTGARRNGIIV